MADERPQDRKRVYPELEREWVDPTDDYYQQRLADVTGGKAPVVVAQLRAATHSRLRHPFQIIGYKGAQRFDDLPVDAKFYQDASFNVTPAPSNTDGEVFDQVNFGYNLYDEFRRIGSLHYLKRDPGGAVKELGFGSELALKYFRHHLFGRPFSPQDREQVRTIQEEVFAYLRSEPKAAESLREFTVSRGWPIHLEDTAHLAYFHNRVTPLERWAQEEGFSPEDMHLAGWFDLNFSNTGQPSFSVRDSHVIRIPYFNREGDIEVWRTRNLRPSRAESHKYTSWPLDRSVERDFTVEEKLYYGWDLGEARGKTLVVTEGEFKCLVATQMSGILTVGIPGITEVDDTIIKGLIDSGAKEYVVILDRDPKGKGLMRVDGITDSERAAYGIAKQLQAAGARRVGVGRIPDVRNGEKVGVDDLILDKGADAYRSIVENALTPEQYARVSKLNPVFFDIWQARQQVRKAVENYDNSVRRGGSQVSPELYDEAVEMRDNLEELYAEFLRTRFKGAFRIDQPATSNHVFFRGSHIRDAEKKIAITEDGNEIPLGKFQNDIVYFLFNPADAPSEFVWSAGGKADFRLPFRVRDMRDFLDGRSGFRPLIETAEQGLALLKADTNIDLRKTPLQDLATLLLAGHLSSFFPDDEYTYERNLAFYVNRDTHWEEHTQVPLTVLRKKSSEAVAFASVAAWGRGEDINNAIMRNRRRLNLVASVLRRPDTSYLRDKYDDVMETVWPYWFDRKRPETVAAMAEFGIPEDVATRNMLVSLDRRDYGELIDHFMHRRLLAKSTGAGFFRFGETGLITPRFKERTVYMPVLDEAGKIAGVRVLPFSMRDHVPPAMDPELKLVRNLHGEGLHLMERFDPERQLYLQENLKGVRGQTLHVAFHELDGLVLNSVEKNVVALNSAFKLSPEVIAKIASSGAKEISFVISGMTPQSNYDSFSYDGIPGFLKDIYDLQTNINNALPEGTLPISVSVTVLENPLTKVSTASGLSVEVVDGIKSSAVNLDTFLKESKFNPQAHDMVRRFLTTSNRLMDYLEILALSDIVDGKPIDWYVRESRRLHSALRTYAQQTHGVEIIDLESYFQQKLSLDEPIAVDELVLQRQQEEKAFLHRPLYSTESHTVDDVFRVSERFRQTFEQVVATRGATTEGQVRNILLDLQPTAIKKGVTKVVTDQGEAVAKPAQIKEVPTIENPKGKYLELTQTMPERFPQGNATFRQLGNKDFRCTLKVLVLPENIEITSTATGQRKRDAEALAYEGVLKQITEQGVSLEPQAKKPQTENPKGRVLEFLQQHGIQSPSANMNGEFTQSSTGFISSVRVDYSGRVYEGSGYGKSKKEAEAAAYTTILDQLHERSLTTPKIASPEQSGLSDALVAKIDTALRMPAGDSNYVGRVFQIAQTTQSREPKFTAEQAPAEEGSFWKTKVTMTIGDTMIESEECWDESKQKSRQFASRSLLGKLHDLINPEPVES